MAKNVKGVADQIDVDRNPQDDTCLGLGWRIRGSYCAISPSDDVCQAPPKCRV